MCRRVKKVRRVKAEARQRTDHSRPSCDFTRHSLPITPFISSCSSPIKASSHDVVIWMEAPQPLLHPRRRSKTARSCRTEDTRVLRIFPILSPAHGCESASMA